MFAYSRSTISVTGENSACGDAPDFAGQGFGEPQGSVRAHSDAVGAAQGAGRGIFVDDTGGGNPADGVAIVLGKPERPVGPGRNAFGKAVDPRQEEFRESPRCSDPPDLADAPFGEPKGPIRSSGDFVRSAARRRNCVLGERRGLGQEDCGGAQPDSRRGPQGTSYDGLLLPLLGFIFLPLTTLAYAWMANTGQPSTGLNLLILIVAVVIDVGGLGGGEYHRRRR